MLVEENTALRDRKWWPCFKVHHGNTQYQFCMQNTLLFVMIIIISYIYLWCVYVYLFFKNHFGSFPTLHLWVQSCPPCRTACKLFCWLFNYGNESNVCSASGFIVKSNNGKRGIASTPPGHVYCKEILLLVPHSACKRRNSPRSNEMCLSEGLQIHRLVAEASQVTIQVLSIDLKRWRKAGIKDGMQFVSAKWVLFSVSVVWDVLFVLSNHCRWLLTPSLLTWSMSAPAQRALS